MLQLSQPRHRACMWRQAGRREGEQRRPRWAAHSQCMHARHTSFWESVARPLALPRQVSAFCLLLHGYSCSLPSFRIERTPQAPSAAYWLRCWCRGWRPQRAGGLAAGGSHAPHWGILSQSKLQRCAAVSAGWATPAAPATAKPGAHTAFSPALQWWPGVWSERDLVADFVGVAVALAVLVAAEAARWPPLLGRQAAAKEGMV